MIAVPNAPYVDPEPWVCDYPGAVTRYATEECAHGCPRIYAPRPAPASKTQRP